MTNTDGPCYNAKMVDCGAKKFAILQDQTLGSGAYAVVKRAVDTTTGRQYAVKIIKVAKNDFRDTAIKELEVAKQLQDCVNLVHIEKIKVQSANHIYLFMQYCNGGTLVEEMMRRKGKFRQDEIYKIFCHLTNGYRVLHQAKVLHEDIKPENVLISNGVYKIADFGLAIFSENYKHTSKRRGTLYYMAFEKLTRKQYTANVKSDIYSLGVLFYELIVGKHPYVEKRGLEIKQFVKEFKDARLRYDNLTGTYSFKFMTFFDIVLKMLTKAEDKRIGWDDLMKFCNTFEPLQPYRKIAPEPVKVSEFYNATYKEIDRSQASLVGLQLEVAEGLMNESVYDKEPALPKAPTEQQIRNEQLKQQLTRRREYCSFINQVIKHLTAYLAMSSTKAPEVEMLLLALHLYRSKVLAPLEDYDPFDCPEQNKEVVEMYVKDSQFVKDEQIAQIGISELPEASKKELIAKFKGYPSAHSAEAYIGDLINRLFTQGPLMIVRIGYKKDLLLLLYILHLSMILKGKLPRTLKQYEQVYTMEQQPMDTIRKWVQDQTASLMVIYDPEMEKTSEQFELLDWQDFTKSLDDSPKKFP